MFNIAKAAFASNKLEAAVAYANLGFSVIPLSGKVAQESWAKYQTSKPEMWQLKRWFDGNYPPNLGVICGQISQNLVVIDLDGTEAIKRFKARFPDLMATYAVYSGSGVGMHLYYIVKTLPVTTRYMGKAGNVEVRSDGCYIVAPPSKHPITGNLYKPTELMIAHVNDLDEVVRWINRLNSHKPTLANHKVLTASSGAGGMNPSWVKAAVEGEIASVLNASEGNRNNALFFASLRLGQLCANPHAGLNQHEMCERLYGASIANGLVGSDGAKATVATIVSGMNRGLQEPRQIPLPHRRAS